MKEECLICKAPLAYLEKDSEMECALCRKKYASKTKCKNGHYVCDACHTRGMDAVIGVCLSKTSKNPIAIFDKLTAMPFCHMHGPEHHILVGSALLTAYHNAGGEINLSSALTEMQARGRKVPGGACGFWGACGAAVSAGMFVAIITNSTPLAVKAWGLSNRMTAAALNEIGEINGPRCCKRNSYTAMRAAVHFVSQHLGVEMKSTEIVCSYSDKNNQCIQSRCPYYRSDKKKIAFVCVHNSCRSQIAQALAKHLAGDKFDFYSAGTEKKPQINQDAVRLIKQLYGIDMEETQYSKTFEKIPTPDIVISMGCDVGCPYIEREFDENWGIPDPTGKSDDVFIDVIRQIEERVAELIKSLS